MFKNGLGNGFPATHLGTPRVGAKEKKLLTLEPDGRGEFPDRPKRAPRKPKVNCMGESDVAPERVVIRIEIQESYYQPRTGRGEPMGTPPPGDLLSSWENPGFFTRRGEMVCKSPWG